jgi:ABC-2 type transport system permease protein
VIGAIGARLEVAKGAFWLGLGEIRTIYTWRAWFTGWILRLVAQVSFFGAFGFLLGERTQVVAFLLIGNSMLVVCMEVSIVVVTVAFERGSGTLPLLAATPVGAPVAYLGRGIQWVVTGVLTGTLMLLVVPRFFGLGVPVGKVLLAVPLILLVAVSCYGYSCTLATFVVRNPGRMWIAVNLGYLLVMTLGGIDVPRTFWPEAVRIAGGLLPMSHGLEAIRAVLAAQGLPWAQVGLEALVGAGWFAVSLLLYRQFVASGRRSGKLDFG